MPFADGVVALTFDCYGTLVDWEQGLLRDLSQGLDLPANAPSGERLLEAYADAEARAEAGPFRPYRTVLREALLGVAAAVGVPVRDADALVRGLPTWPVFADTREALQRLGRRFRLCVVSNVDRDLFAETERAISVRFDAVVTADEVRAYKPSPAHFEEAARRLGLGPGGLLHVAQSLFHDVVPAKRLGLRTVWVDRRAGRAGGATRAPAEAALPDVRVTTLRALAELLAP